MKHVILFILFSLAWRQPTYAAPTGQELFIFYSNDVQGESEVCGCQSNQLGGLSKKGFQFKILAADSDRPHLTLDAGNLLFKDSAITPSQTEQGKMAARAIVEAYGLSGYQAVAVGALDLSAGIGFLRTIANQAKFSWLSANLVETSTRKAIFPPSISLKVGEVKATVIGLTGPTPLAAEEQATLLPWDQVLPSLLDQAASTSDLTILLSNLPSAENQRIAETYSSIHLLIQSRPTDNSASFEPIEVNNTVLASTMPQGKEIGVMGVIWQPSKRWGDSKPESLSKKKAALDSLLWQLGKYQRHENPETALRDQPEQLKAYHLLLERQGALQRDIEALTTEISGGRVTGEPSSYRNRFIVMEESLPGQPEIVALFDKLDRDLNKLGEEKAKTLTVRDSPYLGSQACAPCHAPQMAAWQQTKHAGAYATLLEKKQQFNTNCLPCHVTGVKLDAADEALSVPENRRGVGCETCHGPGLDHIKDPKRNALTSRPDSTLCQGCHAPPHDTTFDYERNSKLVH